jgi:adenylyltransferase/sulfurtransferase
VASVIGAVQVQEALKLIHREELESGKLTSLCGKMLYYDGEHLTTRIADFAAYDDDCAEHEPWTPVRPCRVMPTDSVAEALRKLSQELETQDVTLCLTQDCYVDYVARRDNDERTQVMCPGRAVEEVTAQDKTLQGVPLSGLYQHEYRHIDRSFPYQELTLAELGLPPHDVLHVSTGADDYYFEMEEA